ncbi:hypothetical protein BC332_21516 [Capsicum chinense]|nr:hypothetical protein BC332_21516 [Capsicum chinense]
MTTSYTPPSIPPKPPDSSNSPMDGVTETPQNLPIVISLRVRYLRNATTSLKKILILVKSKDKGASLCHQKNKRACINHVNSPSSSKKVNHSFLKKKLIEMWKLKEAFPLIDLGLDYFTVKLAGKDLQQRILQDGPWFVAGAYASVRIWKPNFIPKLSTIESTTIWIRLPQLPTKYYDGSILERVGRKVGKLLKVDARTSATLRDRYERLCIQVSLDEPLISEINIGKHCFCEEISTF